MSTTFAFGFDADDIEDDENGKPFVAAQDANGKVENSTSIPPQLHTLHDIVGPTFPCSL